MKYGDFLVDGNMHRKSITAYRRSRKLGAHAKSLNLRFARSYIVCGDSVGAEAELNDLLSHEDSGQAYCLLALVRLDQEDYVEAEEMSRKAISVDSSNAEAHYYLAKSLDRQQKPGTTASLRRAVELDSELVDAWKELGRILGQNADRADDAIDALERAVSLDGDDPYPSVQIANIYWRINDRENADLWYQRALLSDPFCENVRIWYDQFLAGGSPKRGRHPF